MRRIIIAALAAVVAVSGIAWAANQVSTDTFRKVLAVELFGSNAALGISGNPVIAGPAAPSGMVRGKSSTTGSSATTIIAAQGSGVKIYATAVQCGRSDAGTTAITVALNDDASTVLVLPNAGNGGGNNMVFPVPLAVAANTAFQFTPSTSITTVYCSAQGYVGA